VHIAAAKGLQAQVDKSIELGARVRLAGGHQEGAFFLPIVLENVQPGMPAYGEEFFGPAASLFKASDADDAVRIANDSPYGLGGVVYTQDKAKGQAVARAMQTGSVYVNATMKSDPALPFGGIKRSGHGRELGVVGLREFTNVQTVFIPS
jgi:succinate-semialdehyde dehydrogenase/glutarate-semialdehyde dehydrogenase